MVDDETTGPGQTSDAPMLDPGPDGPPKRQWLSMWLTGCLAIVAVGNLVFWINLAIGLEDTEVSESPLMLAIARQLIVGPTELYGPYIDGHRLVLIHPPFYYNLATLVAWPLARMGCDKIVAALIAGRSISFLSLLILLPIVYRLTRLDGARRLTGVWAALLVAGSPILGGIPFTIRPDTLGILFQTAGILWAMTALRQERPRPGLIYLAFAAFGLAACVKQHLVAGPTVTLVLLTRAYWRGRVPFRVIERSLMLIILIVGVIYGAEELLTRGRMSEAVLGVAGRHQANPTGGVRAGDFGSDGQHEQDIRLDALFRRRGRQRLHG